MLRRFLTISMSIFSVSMRETCTFPWSSRSIVNCFAMNRGNVSYTAAFLLDKFFSTYEYFSSSAFSILNFLLSASSSLSSAIRLLMSGTNSKRPSGTSTVPKFLPASALLTTESTIKSMTLERCHCLAATSSDITHTLGCV